MSSTCGRAARQFRHDRELRSRQPHLAQVALVNLRDVAGSLPQREAIALVVGERSVHAMQYMCAYTQSQWGKENENYL